MSNNMPVYVIENNKIIFPPDEVIECVKENHNIMQIFLALMTYANE